MLDPAGHHRLSENNMKAVPKMNDAFAPRAAASQLAAVLMSAHPMPIRSASAI